MSMEEYKLKVDQSEFYWNRTEGLFQFEGDDAVLFWVKSAFKTFLDSIEEVTGEDAARIVMETAGYRTGKIVSEYYEKQMGELDRILQLLPSVYINAGWGVTNIISYSPAEKKAQLSIANDWEEKVVQAQGKKEPGSFLAGHWSGVLSGLFKTDIWYKILKSPSWGDDQTVIEFFPSDITPQGNIHDLARQKEQSAIVQLEAMVEDRTIELENLVKELSTPIIPVLDGIVVVPLVGKFDESRANELLEAALQGVVDFKASVLILDVTGIKEMDDFVIGLIEKVTQAIALIGAVPIVVGISSELSLQLTNKSIYLNDLKCFATLKHGVHYALSLEGLKLTSTDGSPHW